MTAGVEEHPIGPKGQGVLHGVLHIVHRPVPKGGIGGGVAHRIAQGLRGIDHHLHPLIGHLGAKLPNLSRRSAGGGVIQTAVMGRAAPHVNILQAALGHGI